MAFDWYGAMGFNGLIDSYRAKIDRLPHVTIDELAQGEQMRSDIVHKCHRYLDDLGKASTEEKDALKAEHDEYSAVCARLTKSPTTSWT